VQQGGGSGSGDKPARPGEKTAPRPATPTPSSPLTRDDGRLTLNFPVVTLALPEGFEEEETAAIEPEPAARDSFPLELDTGELHVSPGEVVAPPPSSDLDLDLTGLEPPLELPRISLPEAERPSRAPLTLPAPRAPRQATPPTPPARVKQGEAPFVAELHTSDFQVVPEKESIAMVHDAWTRDRMVRRAPTPMGTPAVPQPTRPTRQLRAQRRTPETTAPAGDALDLVDGARRQSAPPVGLAGEMSER
jgi:hypothetical protein